MTKKILEKPCINLHHLHRHVCLVPKDWSWSFFSNLASTTLRVIVTHLLVWWNIFKSGRGKLILYGEHNLPPWFLIARLAWSNPRNHFIVVVVNFLCALCSNFRVFHHVVKAGIHIECSKQFKWNLYFYVSGQSRPFWAVLKLLKNSNMKFKYG